MIKDIHKIILCSIINDEYSKNIWKEIILSIYYAIIEKNKTLNLEIVYFKDQFNYNDNNLYIIFGYHQFTKFPKNYIIFQSERLFTRWNLLDKTTKLNLINIYQKAYNVWDYSKLNIIILKQNNIINCQYVPFFETKNNINNIITIINNIKKTTDILWLGNIYLRRRIIILRLKELYKNKLKIVESGFFFHKKLQLIASSKIYINICGDEPKISPLNLYKIKYGFITKSLIISEITPDKEMYDLFKDVIVFVKNTDEMIEKINYYLMNEKERAIITNRAYEKFSKLDLKDYIHF